MNATRDSSTPAPGTPAPSTLEAGTGARRSSRDRPWALVLLAGIFGTAILATTLRQPDGAVVSSDPGYTPVPVPLLLVPTALCIALTLLLPRGGDARIRVRAPRAAAGESIGLLALAAAFPLLVPLLPLPEDYVLLKLALLMLLPALVLGVRARRGASSIVIPRPGIGPWILLPPLVLGVLATLGPFSPGRPSSWPPLEVLLIAATATAITASFGEELFYRRLLQPRLEGLLGPWTGLLLASIIFGLMHVPSHGGGAWGDIALQAIALQGTTGIALGVMWMRWRRLWVCVLAHLLLNGLSVLVHVGGLALAS